MTGADYRKALERLGLSSAEAARLFDVDVRTVQRWLNDEVPVPQPIAMLLTVAIKKNIKPAYLLGLLTTKNHV